jgi:FKBP-type peptidyl-prolyl cis-trans isomerase
MEKVLPFSSMHALATEATPGKVVYIDISTGNGDPVTLESQIEILFTGTALAGAIWGSAVQNPVSEC